MIPSIATIRRYVYARTGSRGGLQRHELALWLRREAEIRELHRALNSLERRACVWVMRNVEALEA